MDTPSPPPGVLVADHFHRGADYETRRRAGTRDWLIAYTIAGVGYYRGGGTTFLARPGDVTLLPPGVPHDYAGPPEGIWDFVWAHFLPRPSWIPWLQLPVVAGGLRCLTITSADRRDRIVAAFERVVVDARAGRAHGALADDTAPSTADRYQRAPSVLTEELALNALEEVLLLCAREQVGGEVSGLDPRIRHILDLLATDLTNAHEVAELAGRVALSPSRLAHLFRAQVGNSVLDTLLQMRLHQAARLLKYTTQGIGEISRVVGFRSPYYFSRQFHQRYGLSASAYRAAVAHIPMHQAVGAVAQLSSDTLSPVPTRGRGAQQ